MGHLPPSSLGNASRPELARRFVETGGAIVATALDDHLVLGGLEGFAVVTGAIGASGAGIADAGDGGLGEGGNGK